MLYICVGALCTSAALHAQTTASFGVGGSFIEYDGLLASGAATLTPAFRIDSRDITFGAQGSWTVFESGNQIVQANAGAAWLSGGEGSLRLELSAAGGALKYAEQSAAGHVLARSRLHVFANRYGGWFTAGAGMSFDSTTFTPFEIGLGAWSVRERLALVGTATAAWVDDDRHVELAAAARWTAGRTQLEARVGGRPWVRTRGFVGDATSGVWADLSALVPISRQVALALSGGTYPSDPVRRVLGATYFTGGFRITLSGGEYSPPLAIPAELEVLRQRNSAHGSGMRLEIIEAGAGYVLRVRVAGARSVELAADFTDWEPTTLVQVGDDLWEIQVQLSRGVHRLNVRVNGGDWMVPGGTRAEPDEYGGTVAVIVVQ